MGLGVARPGGCTAAHHMRRVPAAGAATDCAATSTTHRRRGAGAAPPHAIHRHRAAVAAAGARGGGTSRLPRPRPGATHAPDARLPQASQAQEDAVITAPGSAPPPARAPRRAQPRRALSRATGDDARGSRALAGTRGVFSFYSYNLKMNRLARHLTRTHSHAHTHTHTESDADSRPTCAGGCRRRSGPFT